MPGGKADGKALSEVMSRSGIYTTHQENRLATTEKRPEGQKGNNPNSASNT